MSCNTEGFKYEEDVISTLVSAGIAGQILEGAGASSTAADADFVIEGERHLVEIKKDAFAQMGGTSVRYAQGNFEPASQELDADTFELIVKALEPRRQHIERLVDFLGGEAMPVSCEKAAWEAAKGIGLLQPINVKVQKDTGFIVDHYRKKGIDYIQIGGAGLFYLDKNPAGLPIPRLHGNIDIELRAGRSGSRKNSQGVSYVGGSLRAQARLKFQGTSPYTLDSEESIKNMLERIV